MVIGFLAKSWRGANATRRHVKPIVPRRATHPVTRHALQPVSRTWH
jgi:hypothetical protein